MKKTFRLLAALFAAIICVGMMHTPANAAQVNTICGQDRYYTQMYSMGFSFDNHADGLVVATGANHADAVVAAGLAGSLGYQFLYVSPTNNEWAAGSSAFASLGKYSFKEIVIVGGRSAVPPAAEAELRKQCPDAHIERVWGKDRYDTSSEVYRYGVSRNAGWGSTAIVVSGPSFADGASCAGLASFLSTPVFFTGPDGELSSATQQLLSAFDEVIIVGGSSVVSEHAEEELAMSSEVTRLSGADRYATNVQVALYELQLDDERARGGKAFSDEIALYFVTGKTFADCIPFMVNTCWRGDFDSYEPRPLVLMEDPVHYESVIEAFGIEARAARGLMPLSAGAIFVGTTQGMLSLEGAHENLLTKLFQYVDYAVL